MNTKLIGLFAALLIFNPAWLLAHGPQLQVTNTGGKITTREIIVEQGAGGTYGPLTDPKSVYTIPLQEFTGQWYSRPNHALNSFDLPIYYSGPGLAFGVGQTFDVGSTLTINYVDGLKRWDGSAFVDPGTEQIQAFRGSNTSPTHTALTTDSGPYNSLSIAPIVANYTDTAHSTIRWRLFGDGVSGASPSQDGVYLLSLQLSSTQSGLLPSDPYYFVLHKNADSEIVRQAVNSLGYAPSQIQSVPEPGILGLAGLGLIGMGILVWRRSNG